jgi:hypothetical protein
MGSGFCEGTDMQGSAVVTLATASSLTIDVSPGGSQFCEGTNLTFTATGGGYGYHWTINGFDDVNSSVLSMQNTTPGDYIVRVSGFNTCDVPQSASYNITILPKVSQPPAISGIDSKCQGAEQTSFQASASHADSYSNWEINPSNAGSIVGSGNTASVTWNSFFSGAATVKVKASGCGGSFTFGTKSIDVTANTVYTLTGGGTICSNAVATLSLSGFDAGVEYTLLRNGSAYSSQLPHDGGVSWQVAEEGVYTVQPVAGRCPGDRIDGSVTVTKISGSTITVDQSPGGVEFCEGTDLSFMASGGSGYHWTLNGMDQNNGTTFSWQDPTPGDYVVQVTGVNTCNITQSLTYPIAIKPKVND